MNGTTLDLSVVMITLGAVACPAVWLSVIGVVSAQVAGLFLSYLPRIFQ